MGQRNIHFYHDPADIDDGGDAISDAVAVSEISGEELEELGKGLMALRAALENHIAFFLFRG